MFARSLLAICIIFGMTISAPTVSYAQGAGAAVAPTITVLDIAQIRRDAASVKSIRDQIVNYQNNFQGEIQKEQEQLRVAQQELAKKQSLLAPEAFADERRKFEQKVVGVQQLVQEKRRALDEAQQNAMLLVEKNLNEIVAEMASKNGYAVVLRRSQVVIVDSSLDITASVLTALDQKLPTVKVDLPAR